jgi:DNA-directed RNA polymerase specialized sigma24 family protein
VNEVTRILSAIEQGDPHAVDQLLPLVYEELRQMAAQQLAHEKRGHTLDPTALVHEAYLRLADQEKPRSYRDRSHFFGAAATSMRRILIDNARRKQSQKRGGVVELRYFAGLTGEQAAEVLGISPTTADRYSVYTRAWLRRELGFGAES